MRQEHCGRLLHTASARGEGGGGKQSGCCTGSGCKGGGRYLPAQHPGMTHLMVMDRPENSCLSPSWLLPIPSAISRTSPFRLPLQTRQPSAATHGFISNPCQWICSQGPCICRPALTTACVPLPIRFAAEPVCSIATRWHTSGKHLDKPLQLNYVKVRKGDSCIAHRMCEGPLGACLTDIQVEWCRSSCSAILSNR